LRSRARVVLDTDLLGSGSFARRCRAETRFRKEVVLKRKAKRKSGASEARASRDPHKKDRIRADVDSSYLDWDEACAYLNVTKRWLRRRVDRRELPFHRFGRLIRFHRPDLDTYIEANRVEAEGR
jgi:excisionase family DNA binding protein